MSFFIIKDYTFYGTMVLVICMKKSIKKIICFILFFVMCYLFIYFGTKDYSKDVLDNVKFHNEYNDVSENNLFTYTSATKILDIINNNGDAIIFMGFPSNTWSHKYASILNDVVMLRKSGPIYYYDFKKEREINSKDYNSILSYLDEYLYITDTGKKKISAPTIIFIKKGKVIYFNNRVSEIKGKTTPEDYFNDYNKNLLINELELAIEEYKGD